MAWRWSLCSTHAAGVEQPALQWIKTDQYATIEFGVVAMGGTLQDELADELYFIAHGTVHIEEESGKFITSIERGSHFGEFALLSVMTGTVGKRSAAARAVTEVELYALKSHDFKEVAGTYPELLEILAYIADARQAVNAGARKATSANTSMH